MKARRILGIILTVMILLSLTLTVAANESEITVLLDGEKLEFDVPPQLINDRTMVPMRKIFESMGAQVEWEETTETVTATKGDITVIMQIDNTVITVNGEEITLDVPPQLVDSRTLVPARAVAESFEATVEWDEENNTVIITSKPQEIDIYAFPSPTIDFTNDDGLMSLLLCSIRLNFEQTDLPKKLFENKETLKTPMVEAPEEFLKFIDNEVWAKSMNTIIIRYITTSEEEYVISSEEDIYKLLNEFADKYSLRAYQNYEVDTVLLADDQYLFLLNMADIYDDLKVDELDKMLISNYIGIVYDSTADLFSYYLLERSLDGTYALCSIDEEGNHSTLGFINNDKKEFVESVKAISVGTGELEETEETKSEETEAQETEEEVTESEETEVQENKFYDETELYATSAPPFSFGELFEFADMDSLYCEMRLNFEQKELPKKLYENKEDLKNAIVENSDEFLVFIENNVWENLVDVLFAENILSIPYGQSGYIFVDGETPGFKRIPLSRLMMNAKSNYKTDIVTLSETHYLVLLNMVDVYDELNVEVNDKLYISTYIGILYDDATGLFSYYLLERHQDDTYAFCSIDEAENHTTLSFINNDKKEFVENIKQINGID